MPENDRLNGCLEEINLEFVERKSDTAIADGAFVLVLAGVSHQKL
jgi:hypothetical protein